VYLKQLETKKKKKYSGSPCQLFIGCGKRRKRLTADEDDLHVPGSRSFQDDLVSSFVCPIPDGKREAWTDLAIEQVRR
jgi:hypothetical protein